jgi:ABC-type branched-subunit amino acid transport system substrate-binding protein/cytochrome c553
MTYLNAILPKPFWLLLFCLLTPLASIGAESDIEKGRRIYMEGMLPSGALLQGMRSGEDYSGKQAACVSCHRPSGMGSVEGDIEVPPITGHYLYRTGDLLLTTMDPRSGKRFNQAHEPYTDATLAKAIRKGEKVDGQTMSELMPRYNLKDDDLRAVTAYLKQLSSNYSPGATKDTVHFATVLTADVDPEKRRILLNTLERAFKQKNSTTVVGSKRTGRRHMVTAAEMVLGTERNWVLDVWDLKGTPDTWRAQLDDYYKKEPVFALLSGTTGTTWQPVHEFCEQAHVPCWMPSVALPVDSGDSFYSLYFQRGVKLEADVLAKYLTDDASKAPHRIVQIYHQDALGTGASAELTDAFKNTDTKVENRPLTQADAAGLAALMADLNAQDAVMLWLDAADLSLLDSIAPPKATIYLSGRMSGAEKTPLAPAWKQAANMIYPYELPDKRLVNLNYFHRWARFSQIEIEDEPLQAEAYFATEFLSETMTEMLDNMYREYLIERAESMLSRSQTAASEVRDRTRQVMRWSTQTPRGKPAQAAKIEASAAGKEKNIPGSNYAAQPSKSTTIYPRMSLGVGQRFASKGAYIVRFEDANKEKLTPLSAWLIP